MTNALPPEVAGLISNSEAGAAAVAVSDMSVGEKKIQEAIVLQFWILVKQFSMRYCRQAVIRFTACDSPSPMPEYLHKILNIPHNDSAESTLARHVEELLDLLAQASCQAEDLHASKAQQFYERLYDGAVEEANHMLGFDVQIMGTMNGSGEKKSTELTT